MFGPFGPQSPAGRAHPEGCDADARSASAGGASGRGAGPHDPGGGGAAGVAVGGLGSCTVLLAWCAFRLFVVC